MGQKPSQITHKYIILIKLNLSVTIPGVTFLTIIACVFFSDGYFRSSYCYSDCDFLHDDSYYACFGYDLCYDCYC